MASNRLLSFAHVSALELTPPLLVQVAAKAGFNYVGMRLNPARPGEVAPPMVLGGPMYMETLAVMRDTGIQLLDFELIWLEAALDVERFSPLMDIAASLGAKHLLVASLAPATSAVVSSFVKLCALAARTELNVSLEFLPWTPLATLHDASKLIREAGCSNSRLMLDPLHLSRSRTDLIELNKISPDLLGYAQLCDASSQMPSSLEAIADEAKYNRMMPGEGGLDLKRFLAALPGDLPLSIEVPCTTWSRRLDPFSFARHAMETTQRVLSEFDNA